MRRYDYKLTSDGEKAVEEILRTEPNASQRIASTVRLIKDSENPSYVELSIAAKVFFILKREGRAMAYSELRREAEKLNWKIQERDISTALELLKRLDLVESGD